ncbi:MAG: tyrosine-type recombinase/integrase [Pseudomonadota bacterium]
MPKKADELSALAVGRIKNPGLTMVGGVAGLGLQVSPGGARSWILRAKVGSLRRDIGLGGFPDVSLAQARELARAARQQIVDGIDPVAEKRRKRAELIATQATTITFDEAAEKYIAAHEAEWTNAKHRAQWVSTLETYVSPVIGKLDVRHIHQAHVLSILEPIWTLKTETAMRIRSRIELVLDWATARKYRSGENPARWRGHLDHLLAKPSKSKKVVHHPALPFKDIAKFMKTLRDVGGVAARALEFCILTAVRSGEIRGATWDEIHLEENVWIIPASRMKAGREHRVPLSDAALALLKSIPKDMRTGLLFPGTKEQILSDMSLTAVLRRMNRKDITVHGFRSTFRDWASETTSYPNEVVEMALAHAIGSAVEAAYRRGDLFEKRASLMADWAKACIPD